MGTFLVTGGAGFIGSHVVDELLAEGHAVRIVDSLDPAAHDGPPGYLDSRADLAVADLVDTPAWSGPLEGVDGVGHQAAKVGMGQDSPTWPRTSTPTTPGPQRSCALDERSFSGRLVLASSMVVYGEGRHRCELHGRVRPGLRAARDLDAGHVEPRCPRCDRPLVPEAVPEAVPEDVLDPRSVYAVIKRCSRPCPRWHARRRGDPRDRARRPGRAGDR